MKKINTYRDRGKRATEQNHLESQHIKPLEYNCGKIETAKGMFMKATSVNN